MVPSCKIRRDVENEGLAEIFIADGAADFGRRRTTKNRCGGSAVPDDLDGGGDADPDIVRRRDRGRRGVGDRDGADGRRDIAEAKALVLVGEDVDRARDDVHRLVSTLIHILPIVGRQLSSGGATSYPRRHQAGLTAQGAKQPLLDPHLEGGGSVSS